MNEIRKPASGVSAPLIALTPSACSMAPTYERPAAPMADDQSGAVAQHQGVAINTLNWKSFIVDAEPRRLTDAALDNNRPLRQILLDIETVRAQYRIQYTDRALGLNAVTADNHRRQPTDLSADNRPEVTSSYQVRLVLSEYELGLFGWVKSLTSAVLQQYLTSEEATRTARATLVVEISQAYLSHDGALRHLVLTRQTLVSREYSFALIGQRHAAGVTTALDYQEALGLMEQARAEQKHSLRRKQQVFSVLVLLLGSDGAAQAISRSPGRWSKLLQDIVSGTPSELIERRLNTLATEYRLQVRNVDIGVARAAFFSRVDLTGDFGTSSARMPGLFDGGSRSWNSLPTLTLPIFDGGHNYVNLSLAEVHKDSAVAAYEGTIQTAFCRVADALVADDTLRREEKALRALTNSSNEILELAKARYESGVDNHLRYLGAQRSNFFNEIVFIDGNTQRQIALVDLFRALGGGWDEGRDLVVHRDGRS